MFAAKQYRFTLFVLHYNTEESSHLARDLEDNGANPAVIDGPKLCAQGLRGFVMIVAYPLNVRGK